MNNYFIFQLIISFVAGGLIVAILSFIAEKANKHIAGIILTVPTTVALGFFFLGWTVSSEAVAKIVPSSLIPYGLTILFASAYPYIAEYFSKKIQNKKSQIFVSYSISIGLWFALATPIVILKLNNLIIGIAVYVIFASLAHFLLQKRKNFEKPITIKYTVNQKIWRAILVGFIIFLAVFLGKTLNPFLGGMFAMFPAVFSSVMIIFHWYYGPKGLFPILQKVAIGSLSTFTYVITAMYVFPSVGFIWGTIISYIVSLMVTVLLMKKF